MWRESNLSTWESPTLACVNIVEVKKFVNIGNKNIIVKIVEGKGFVDMGNRNTTVKIVQ